MAISVKRLTEAFGTYAAKASTVPELRIADLRSALVDCERGKVDPGYVLDVANEVLGGHGVERIQADDDNVWSPRESHVAYYVNMGDTYHTTLLWDRRTGTFQITCWGDWYERTPAYKQACRAWKIAT